MRSFASPEERLRSGWHRLEIEKRLRSGWRRWHAFVTFGHWPR